MGPRHKATLPGFFLTLAVCLTLLHASVSHARPAPNPGSAAAFNRQEWPHWLDSDHDCQDTRAEILLRDSLGPIKFKRNKPCNVSWGLWLCPYTGREIRKASELDIDHLVPLAHAHRHGGANWSREKKRAFANDPLNLIAVAASANRAKGDQGPEEWRPPQRSFWPEYAKRWRAVKAKYGLFGSPAEEAALAKMARGR